MTCDAFLSGINSSEICKRLLEENDLDFQTAVRKYKA